ncbi:hypothetical protein CapIbe_012405 [Capra ibex]
MGQQLKGWALAGDVIPGVKLPELCEFGKADATVMTSLISTILPSGHCKGRHSPGKDENHPREEKLSAATPAVLPYWPRSMQDLSFLTRAKCTVNHREL